MTAPLATATTVQRDPLVGARVAVALRDTRASDRVARELRAAGCLVQVFPGPDELVLDPGQDPFQAVVGALEASRLDAPTLRQAIRDRCGATVSLVPATGEEADEPISDRVRTELRLARRTRAAEDTPCARPAEATDDPVLPCQFEGHELLGVLGRGGYGVVYEARRLVDGRRVALKLLTAEASRDPRRFLSEVEALSVVRSPHVVKGVASGHAGDRRYVVMDLVDGRPASALGGLTGQCDVTSVVRIARDVCAAIEALQRCELVHRDIKPANILVDEDGRALLVDLGLAQRSSRRDPASRGFVSGTLAYIAPEVVRGRPEDAGSDLYSLGVTLWELLAGRPAVPGDSADEVFSSLTSGRAVPDVRQVRPDVPASVAWLVARLTDPDPDRRLRDPAVARRAFGVVAWATSPTTSRAA